MTTQHQSPTLVLPEFVRQILDRYEARNDAFPEYQLAGDLQEAAKSQQMNQEERDACWAESAAFRFSPRRRGELSDWGTHFGPLACGIKADKTKDYFPDIANVDEEILVHWAHRVTVCKHPVMRARYADLLWDMQKIVTGRNAEFSNAHAAIDSYIVASKLPLSEESISQIQWAERALELAISIGDKARIVSSRDAMFDLYGRIAVPQMLGTWPFLFDNLYNNKKIPLAAEQEGRIITSLEETLCILSDPSKREQFNPWGAENAAGRLAKHYKRLDQPCEIERVIRTYGKAFEHIAQIANPLQAMAWLQPVFETYQQFGLADDAQRVQLASKAKGADANSAMAQIRVPIQVSKVDLENFLTTITAGTLDQILIRIAQHFIPKAKDAQEHLDWLSKEHPIEAMIGIRKINAGQVVAEIGSITDDPNGRLIAQIRDNIAFAYPLLGSSIERFVEKLNPNSDEVLTFLYQSPIFDPERRNILKSGLDAYLEKDHMIASHLLIPQIEHCLRRLVGVLGLPTNKRVGGEVGVMEEKNLNHILEYEDAVRACLGDDVRLYLLTFLADRRGYNVRNLVSHGLMAKFQFTRELADRLFHILLVLGLLRNNTTDNSVVSSEQTTTVS